MPILLEPNALRGEAADPIPDRNIVWQAGGAGYSSRAQLLLQHPATIWLTGLSGAGKSTIAFETEKRLMAGGHLSYVLDGDNVRHGLNRDLGFSPQDRKENIRRIAEVARLFNEAGLLVIAAFISPYREDRRIARSTIGAERFVEVHVDAPIETCEARDVKGLYAKARSGKLPGFTGISAPYEPPPTPAVRLNTEILSLTDSVDTLLCFISERYLTV